METYTKYVVRTKHIEGKPDKYLRKTYDRWNTPKSSLSTVESDLWKFDTIWEAQVEATEYVDRHKSVKMKDLEVAKVEFSAKVLETIEVKDPEWED